MMGEAYDDITSLYHLIYEDWDATIAIQSGQLASILRSEWSIEPGASILDVSCGIGTQAIGLAGLGFQVTGSDLSAQQIIRAHAESQQRGVNLDLSVCDMRQVNGHHHRQFDAVISGDNSVTHLLSDDDILQAFTAFFECLRPGGACLITVRDYAREDRGTGIVKLYGTRDSPDGRYLIFQVWDFEGELYDLSMFFVHDRPDRKAETRVMRARYYAVSTDRLLELFKAAGFIATRRLDGAFFQPVLIATKPA